MKGIKVTLATAASALLLAAPAMAYHDGGVAKCEGCHTMHNSLNGTAMQTSGTGNLGTVDHSGPYLLQGGNQPSDACLNCHEGPTLSGYHVSSTAADGSTTFPVNRTPGGDFAWLKATTGVKGGHNILGLNHGYSQATKFAGGVAPGGTYPVANLQCSSCHDPHGKYRRVIGDTVVLPSIGTSVPAIQASGSYNNSPAPTAAGAVGVYRILGGVGYVPKSISDKSLAFVNGPPVAVAPSTYNQSESANMVRVAYGSGMSEWCANCHGAIAANAGKSTSNTDGGHTHPAGPNGLLTGGSADLATGGSIAGNYNAYVASGNLTGTQATSFDSLVPYEEGVGVTYATLAGKATNAANGTAGPNSGTEQAMCLSCHRVHASGFASMLRFQVDNSFINNTDSTGTVVNWSSFADVNNYKTAAYYDKPATKYGAYQRPLCNKCHAKD